MRHLLTKSIALSIAVLFCAVAITSSAQVNAAVPPLPKIGTNLNNYVAPAPGECDITVPIGGKIQAAIDSASNGNTVCVSATGIYKENVEINKSIRLSGLGANTTAPKIIGQKGENYEQTLKISANNVTVEGLYIKGAGLNSAGTAALRSGTSISDATIRYNKLVSGKGETVLRGNTGQNNLVIKNNYLSGSSSPYLVFIDNQTPASDNISILNNRFIGKVAPLSTSPNNTGFELVVRSTNNLIKGNVFTATAPLGSVIHGIIQSNNSYNVINQNNFKSTVTNPITNGPIKVQVGSGAPGTDATHNWWGDLSPSDNAEGNIDYSNYETRAFPVY